MIIHDWIVNNLSKTGIVIEAGTYDGTDTILLAKHLNEGKIYGFEPVQSLYNKTIIKTKDYNNIKMFNLALSDNPQQPLTELNDINVRKDSKYQFNEDDLQVLKKLGQGSGGAVYKVLHKPTGIIMARKV